MTLAFELRRKRFAVLTEYPRIPGVFLFNTENERWIQAPAQHPQRPGFRFRARRAGRRVHAVVHAVARAPFLRSGAWWRCSTRSPRSPRERPGIPGETPQED